MKKNSYNMCVEWEWTSDQCPVIRSETKVQYIGLRESLSITIMEARPCRFTCYGIISSPIYAA